MAAHTQKHLFLFGQKHAGKSTVGRRLAEQLEVAFLDLDDLIVELANATLTPPAEDARAVYLRHGAAGFRDLEAEAARKLSDRLAVAPPTVCALGGGTVQNDSAHAALEGLGYFVYLYLDTEELYRRISRTGRPAFLTSDDPKREFERIAAKRDSVYRRRADVVVDLGTAGPGEAAEILEKHVGEYGFGRQ